MNATMASLVELGMGHGAALRAPVLAVPTKQSSQQIPAKTDIAIRSVTSLVDDILTTVVDSHDGAEFDKWFPAYAQLVLAYSAIVRQTVPPAVMQRFVWQSLCEEEGEFREKGQAAFGEELKSRAIFTVWSLRKIGDLIEKIAASPELDGDNKNQDNEFCRRFTLHAIRARFSLDCLHFAMRHHSALSPEIVEHISDGMRSAVDSYAWARQGLDLRLPPQELPDIEVEWDEEDEELLQSSMDDWHHEDQSA